MFLIGSWHLHRLRTWQHMSIFQTHTAFGFYFLIPIQNENHSFICAWLIFTQGECHVPFLEWTSETIELAYHQSLVGWQWCLGTQSGYTVFGSGVSDSRRAVESSSLIVGGVSYFQEVEMDYILESLRDHYMVSVLGDSETFLFFRSIPNFER